MAHFFKCKSSHLLLLTVFITSLFMKVSVLDVGAPYVTIDDQTMFEGGFLIWFGNAPPQRMFLESWISGILSILTYIGMHLTSGDFSFLVINLVADAYKDFYAFPDPYVFTYRIFTLFVDISTAGLVYLVARRVLENRLNGWGAILVTCFYLLSYNTIWCNIVARPDTIVAFFGMVGIYLYYRSIFGDRVHTFWMSGVALGLAAGMKLHAAFFAIFIVLDLIRIKGMKAGLARCFPFVILSSFSFAIAAGTPIFDPLLYLKLRYLNAIDDASPWIQWGEQFIVILRGTGWLIAPMVIGAILVAWKTGEEKRDKPIVSILFISMCWLILFGLIRPLRAYWMLPVLPLFYISALFFLDSLKYYHLKVLIISCVMTVLICQIVSQVIAFEKIEFGELRSWVKTNVIEGESLFIFGYEALNLPRNGFCIAKLVQGLQRKIDESLVTGNSYVRRHILNWEEKSDLELLSMLDHITNEGYSYFSFYVTPLDKYKGIIEFNDMKYVLIQEHFDSRSVEPYKETLKVDFCKIAQVVGPGGGGKGLRYDIYSRQHKSCN